MNDLDGAIEWIEVGLKLAKRAQWPALFGLGWHCVGAVRIKRNRTEEAMAFLREAVRIITPFGESANSNAACLLLRSELMKTPGDGQEALTLFRQGRSIALRLGTVKAQFVAARDLARLLVRLRRFEAAAQETKAALRIALNDGNAGPQGSAVTATLQRLPRGRLLCRAGPREGHDMVHRGADTYPFADLVVMV